MRIGERVFYEHHRAVTDKLRAALVDCRRRKTERAGDLCNEER